jgi:hypothetical protein
MTRRLLAGAIVALIPALAGCEAGLDAPTSAFHPAANGAYETAGTITINNAFVLGSALNQSLPAGSDAGLFLSIYSANGDQLQSASAVGMAASVKLTDGAVNIPSGGSVNLTGPRPEIVLHNLSEPLAAGQVVTLVLDFATVGYVTVHAPVQPQAYAYSTYAQPTLPAPSASPTTTASTTATHHKKKKKHPHASATPTAPGSDASTITATDTASPTPSATP